MEKSAEKFQILETKEGVEKEQSNWEGLVDVWIEQKIQRGLNKIIREKYKGDREEVKEQMRQNWQNRLEAENNLKKKLKRILPRIFKNFAVHGTPQVNEKGERVITKWTDLDAKACLGLMELVGWGIKTQGKEKNVNYIDFDQHLENTVHLDVGQY